MNKTKNMLIITAFVAITIFFIIFATAADLLDALDDVSKDDPVSKVDDSVFIINKTRIDNANLTDYTKILINSTATKIDTATKTILATKYAADMSAYSKTKVNATDIIITKQVTYGVVTFTYAIINGKAYTILSGK